MTKLVMIIIIFTIVFTFVVVVLPLLALLFGSESFQTRTREIALFAFFTFCGTLLSFFGGMSFGNLFLKVDLKFDVGKSFSLIVWGFALTYMAVSIFLRTHFVLILRLLMHPDHAFIVFLVVNLALDSFGFIMNLVDEIKKVMNLVEIEEEDLDGIIMAGGGIAGLVACHFSGIPYFFWIGILYEASNFAGILFITYACTKKHARNGYVERVS